MDWIEIINIIIGFIIGGGLSTIITIGLYRRIKKTEVEKLEIDVRKLQDSELRDRAVQLIQDLSEANETIKRISGELQAMIAKQADSDIRIAHLEAENKRLLDERKNKFCSKYLFCLDFENNG